MKKKITFDEFNLISMYEYECEIYGKKIAGDFTVSVSKEDIHVNFVSAFDDGESMVQIQDREIVQAIQDKLNELIPEDHMNYYEDKLADEADHAYDCWKDDQYD